MELMEKSKHAMLRQRAKDKKRVVETGNFRTKDPDREARHNAARPVEAIQTERGEKDKGCAGLTNSENKGWQGRADLVYPLSSCQNPPYKAGPS